MNHTRIKAVLFDFDGTLTRPDNIDFPKMKRALGCPEDQMILEFIASLPDPSQQREAHKILEQFELEAAELAQPQPGLKALTDFLRSYRIPFAILTRNTREAVERSLSNFNGLNLSDFALIIDRNAPAAPKPEPDGIRYAAEQLRIPAEEIMMVGDIDFDIQAGIAAGSLTAFVDNGIDSAFTTGKQSDFIISNLKDLIPVIQQYLPLSAGKLPNEMLQKMLQSIDMDDPSVIVHPGIGEDTAAVNVSDEEVLILKSDPITFATDAIGHYAVLVNANDIATSGAIPRWLLTTLLFPPKTTPAFISRVLDDLESVCRQWHITLCGGHTEITDAVTRPIISGTLAGTVPRSGLIDKKNMRPGDKILLTKGVSVEGTSIIAREFGEKLSGLGMTENEITTCKNFLSQISILKEAEIAAQFKETSAMHDITEGGIATALEELSIAGGHAVRVYVENIPVFPQTRKICELLEIHPLGLIGSGSLLIACRESVCKELIRKIFEAGIQVTMIGEVIDPGNGIEAIWEGHPAEWPKFAVDEITRLF